MGGRSASMESWNSALDPLIFPPPSPAPRGPQKQNDKCVWMHLSDNRWITAVLTAFFFGPSSYYSFIIIPSRKKLLCFKKFPKWIHPKMNFHCFLREDLLLGTQGWTDAPGTSLSEAEGTLWTIFTCISTVS